METYSIKFTQTAIFPKSNQGESLIHNCEIIFVGPLKKRNSFKANLLHVLAINFNFQQKK